MKIFSILLLLVMVACGSSRNTDEKSETEVTDAEATEEVESVFDPLVQSIDKANAVEDIVMQQKLQMDEALKEMEGETDDSKP
ncbi:MAG: hypothetical protein GXP15_04755 [Gammaproteobacteria bacterium]|nr:hypothetical protein [Gammaproteobacteria bacterium]